MRAFPIFLAAVAIVTPARAAMPVPSLAKATLEQWTAATRRAVEGGDFVGWREALAEALAKVAAGENRKEFLVCLLTSREALEDYHGMASAFKMKARRTHGLEGWREIWNECSESRDKGLWRRVAAACAIAFAEPRGNVTPRERFDFYRSSRAAGQLVPYFDKALPFELALTVHAGGRGTVYVKKQPEPKRTASR